MSAAPTSHPPTSVPPAAIAPPTLIVDGSPPGFVSHEARGRMLVAAGVLVGICLLGQFVLPRVFKLLFTPLGVVGGARVKAQQVNNAVLYEDQVWYVQNVASLREGNRTQLMAIPVSGEQPARVAAVVDPAEPWLLPAADRLWVLSARQTACYQGGQIRKLAIESSLDRSTRPFLYDGRPAVIQARPGGFALVVLQDAGWQAVRSFAIVIEGQPQQHANENFQVITLGGKLHLFYRPLGVVFHREGIPEEGQPADQGWQKAADTGLFSQWKAVALGEQLALFHHVADRGGGPSLAGFVHDGTTWTEFFSHPISWDIGLGICPGAGEDSFFLLRRVLPLGTEMIRVENGKVAWRRDQSGDLKVPAGYRVLMSVPRLIPPLLSIILAVVLTVLMARLRVGQFRCGPRQARAASVLRRGVAAGIDAIIVIAPLASLVVIKARAVLAEISLGNILSAVWQVGCFALVWLPLAYLLFSVLEGATGRTPGKWLAGIRVVNLQLGTPGIGRALLRNLIRVADALFWCLVALAAVSMTGRWQRLGDLAAGTLVVRGGPAAVESSAPAVPVPR